MALALKKSGDAEKTGGPKHSLKKRLHAWWEGYELGSVADAGGASGTGDDAGDGAGDVPDGTAAADGPEWSPARQKLVQLIWGEGFISPKTDFYDGCLLRDTLVAIDDKDTFLDTVLSAVKPGKPIVITESFITAPEPGPLATASIEGEPGTVFPCEASLVIEKLEASNFEIRVNEDETAQYTALACAAWVEMADKITGKDIDDDLAAALVRETELWERRNDAYAAGELEMRRIVAFKKSNVS